ncbi:helix-turn-helix domain-containing protein [Rhizobium helianthi]|uniref:Helix-turn-helix domain-containing protein n=1 Tax=Rhizobium helianthi TaxID=1132695 RepID=A0ABW4M2Z4_9HYPH
MTISQTHFNHHNSISLAEAIAEGRRAAGYSFDDLAIACGLTVSELEALEKGRDQDPVRLKRVASALQLHHLVV